MFKPAKLICTICASLLLVSCASDDSQQEMTQETPKTRIDLMQPQQDSAVYEDGIEPLAPGRYDSNRVIVYDMDEPLDALDEQDDDAFSAGAQRAGSQSSVQVFPLP